MAVRQPRPTTYRTVSPTPDRGKPPTGLRTLLRHAPLLVMLAGCDYRIPPETPKYPREMLSAEPPTAQPDRSTAPRTAALVAASATAPEDGQWLLPLKDYAGTRYSGLDQIRASNVADLRLSWSYDLGLAGGQEATPIVADGTLYLVTSFPNRLLAFDLTGPEPLLRWSFEPHPSSASQGAACCDGVNRGAAYAAGRLFFATLDAHAIAVDGATGTEVWRTRIGDYQKGETVTMAPLVIGGLVLFGNSGGEFGARGWLKALDAATGDTVWTVHSTGPDSEVGIGPSFAPFYEKDRGTDLGVATWPAEKWKTGGGTAWGWLTYDPELDLLYHGTGNAAPWNPDQRRGENKWTASVFARRPATGEAVWAYQWDPHNLLSWDGVGESTLLDMVVDGQPRRVLLRAERNGYVYVMDRTTGEVLSATMFLRGTVVKDVDVGSGRPVMEPEQRPRTGHVTHGVCPGVAGARGWEPTAFSPRTGLLYIAAKNVCMDIEAREANHIAGTPYIGARLSMHAGPGGHRGELIGWDPVAAREVWKVREDFVTGGGPLATAGDLVFYGTFDRWFKAVDARTGELLWRFQTATGINAPPISFLGADGKQYVAVASGPGGWAGSVVSRRLDPRDEIAARGFAYAMRDLPEVTGPGGHLYLFALP